MMENVVVLRVVLLVGGSVKEREIDAEMLDPFQVYQCSGDATKISQQRDGAWQLQSLLLWRLTRLAIASLSIDFSVKMRWLRFFLSVAFMTLGSASNQATRSQAHWAVIAPLLIVDMTAGRKGACYHPHCFRRQSSTLDFGRPQ